MQDFKFQSYVEFYDFLTPEHQQITSLLKDIILDTIPDVKEKLSWNVPFFYKKKTICYVWPGSVPWGKKTSEGVTLGFNQGHLLDHQGYLEAGNRKQIHNKVFYSIEEVERDVDILIQLLEKANALDKKK